MKLEDKLNLALKDNYLYPSVSQSISTDDQISELPQEDTIEDTIEGTGEDAVVSAICQFESIEQAVEQVDMDQSDEFGVISVIVDSIDENLILPKKIGNYIVDDAQRTRNGRYEVHLVSDQK